MLIPTQLQNSEFRFILLKASEELDKEGRPIGKAPKELNWQTTKNYGYKQIQEQFEKQTDIAKTRAGIIPKYGNLFFIDVDKKGKHFESISLLVESLGQTFTVKTYSDGKHYYFFSKDAENKNLVDNSGEIRADRRYILAGNSKLRGKEYQVIKDIPIAEVEWKEVLAVLDDYLIKTIEKKTNVIKTETQTQTIQNILDNKRDIKLQTLLQGNWSAYTSRSEAEMALVQKLVFYNLTKEQVFEIMDNNSQLGKWKEKPDRYKEMTYSKALLLQPEKLTEAKQKPVEEETIKSGLKIKNVEELFNLKPNKDFIVDQFIYPQNIIMLFSPPKNYKSILALKLCMDIANGKKFFGLKTKKSNVLYCDRENNENLIHQRLHALRKGAPKEYSRKKFPLHFLIRQGDLESELWVSQLIDTVKEHDIKMVVFDTMKRYSTNFDENNANDVNRIYTKVYQPLIDECNCSILFLHHTNRDGQFRGSGDFLGLVDSAYSISKNKKSNEFKISCLAARGGEIDNIQGTIELEQDEHKQLTLFKFIQKSQEEIQETSKDEWVKKKGACDLIMTHFKTKGLDTYRKKDIQDAILMEQKGEISESTITRAFKYLVFKEILVSDGKGNYSKVSDWVVEGV